MGGASAERFAHEIAATCPARGECWFRITEVLPGLPCELCGWPTRSVRDYRRTCRACAAHILEARPDARVTEEPTHCDHCDP